MNIYRSIWFVNSWFNIFFLQLSMSTCLIHSFIGSIIHSTTKSFNGVNEPNWNNENRFHYINCHRRSHQYNYISLCFVGSFLCYFFLLSLREYYLQPVFFYLYSALSFKHNAFVVASYHIFFWFETTHKWMCTVFFGNGTQ